MIPVKKEYDVVVIGSGGAGSAAANTACKNGASVLLVSKDPIVCSDSKISEGIMTVRGSGSDKDTEEELSNNIQVQGDDLNNPNLVKAFAKDSQESYQWLTQHGIKPTLNTENGQPQALTIPMGGHTLPRSINHKNGGLDYAHACWNAITKGQIDIIEDAWFLDLYSHHNTKLNKREIGGGLIYHASEGEFISVKAKSVIIACGGLSTLYFPHTDTMKGNTGDSYALAARAGAKLIDMEQVQFIPFAVAHPPSYQGLVVGEPVTAGVLGNIKDSTGSIIKSEVMARTRAECAAAIANAIANGKGTKHNACYLDLTANNQGDSGRAFNALMQEKIPGILKLVKRSMGQAASTFQEKWEVKPSAHYLMGGVEANEYGQVIGINKNVIKGLYVAGQALGGLHGSNRLGSTSLAEGIIFGKKAGNYASKHALKTAHMPDYCIAPLEENTIKHYMHYFNQKPPQPNKTTTAPIQVLRKLQKSAWQGLGPARTEAGITNTLAQIQQCKNTLKACNITDDLLWNQPFIDAIECENLLLCAEAIAHSANLRRHSLGAHVRLDSPKTWRPTILYKPAYSIAVFWQQHQMQIIKILKTRSPLSIRLSITTKQYSKIILFKLLKNLPFSITDKVLFKIYNNALTNKISKQN